MPPEKHKALSSEGGKASGEARREKKTMRTRLDYLLSTTDKQGNERGDQVAEAIVTAAVTGNMKAAKLIGDYCGEFKQRIEVEEVQEPPAMTEGEAAAIYIEGLKELNSFMWCSREEKDKDREPFQESEYVKQAIKTLKIDETIMISHSMHLYNIEGGGYDLLKDFFEDCNNNIKEFKQAIKEAAGLKRDDAFDHVREVVQAYRDSNRHDERATFKPLADFYFDCLTFYICARSEQYRKDHPEEAAPPTPPSPYYHPAKGQPYPEEW